MSDAAITTIVSGIITITTLVIGFLTLWVKVRYGTEMAEKAAIKAAVVETKIDDNTKVTKAGATAAVENAKIAATVATEAKVAAEEAKRELEHNLNGGLDVRIHTIVKTHTDPIVESVKEIKQVVTDLKGRIK